MHRKSAEAVQALFQKSAQALQAGDMAAARHGFLKLGKQLPESFSVWYNLGLCQQHLGQHAAAVKSYQRALRIDSAQADAWVNLGISRNELEQSPQALHSAQKAIKLNPGHSRALNLIGSILAAQEKFDEARRHLQAALAADAQNDDAACNLVKVELATENSDSANRLLRGLEKRIPQHKRVRLLRGTWYLHIKDYQQATPLIRELEQQYPGDQEVLRLALSLREAVRDHFGAIEIAEKLLQQNAGDAATLNSLGGACFQLDAIEKSRAYYRRAAKAAPDNAEYLNNLGLAHASMGDRENAEACYRKALHLNPRHAEAWRNIVAMKRFDSITDADAEAVIALWQEPDLAPQIRTRLAFALGKIYDDCGLSEEAFATYKTGNDLKFRESTMDLDAYLQHIDSVSQIFDRPPGITSDTAAGHRPVFVLGMPRSGTTLIETVLTRHSAVVGCGELPCIERAITRLEKKSVPMRVYPNDFPHLTQRDLAVEADEYLRWVARLHDIDVPYFVDKMPFNFVHVWLIRALFPDSPIINCRRHPLDVILSNYFQLYGSEISFVYELTVLANYYIRYHNLMRHWSQIFGAGAIVDVVYERFVAEPESETRALVDAVGLPWEDGCLDPGRTNAAVRTASIWQVRQGIYTSSRERWRKYADKLQGVIAILCAAQILDADGNWIAQ